MTARRKGGGARRAEPKGLAVSQLAKAVAGGRVERAYLCLGEERLLVKRAIDLIESQVITEANRVWGREELSAGESSAAEISASATQAPMLGGQRLVIVREVERLRKADKETFPGVLEHVPDSTVLVMTATKLDGRTAFSRDLKARATLVRCDQLADEFVPAWIKHELAARYPDHQMDEDAIARLHLLAGQDLGTLAGELDKLVHYAGKSRRLRREDVDRVVAAGAAASLADLVEAVGERDQERALGALASVLETGTAPVQIIAFLGYRVHDLWRAADHAEGWIRPEARRQARAFDPGELRRAAVAVFEADQRLKSSAGSPRLVLEALVRGLAG